MPSYQEFEGKDVDDAAQRASKKLKTPLGDLKYDVISYGSTGFSAWWEQKRPAFGWLSRKKKHNPQAAT